MWIALLLPKLRLAWPTNSPNVADVCAKHFELIAEESFKYTIDGDLYTDAKKLDLRVGPVLEFVQ